MGRCFSDAALSRSSIGSISDATASPAQEPPSHTKHIDDLWSWCRWCRIESCDLICSHASASNQPTSHRAILSIDVQKPLKCMKTSIATPTVKQPVKNNLRDTCMAAPAVAVVVMVYVCVASRRSLQALTQVGWLVDASRAASDRALAPSTSNSDTRSLPCSHQHQSAARHRPLQSRAPRPWLLSAP